MSHIMIQYIYHRKQKYPLEGLTERVDRGFGKVINNRRVCLYRPALYLHSANVLVEQVCCIKLPMTQCEHYMNTIIISRAIC